MNKSRHDAFRERGQANPTCAECLFRVDSPEVYTVTRYRDNTLLAFDIELAHEFCKDGRAPVEVPAEILNSILQLNAITPEHVDHVDTNFPGIAAPVDRTPEGEPILGLIDGSHRAAKCQHEGRSFFAFHLTAEETQQCQQTDTACTCVVLEHLLRSRCGA